jgi:hypothetical protein
LREITVPGTLLDERGELAHAGWARRPYLDCNLEKARSVPLRALQALRLKRWDYYAIVTPECFFSATLAHLGYVGSVFVYILDFAKSELVEENLLVPLGRGIHLARNSDAGESWFDNGRVRVAFEFREDTRRVQVRWPNFDSGRGIAADFTLRCSPQHESVVTMTPMGRRRFFYTRKINCLPGEGWIEHGHVRIELRPTQCLGTVDWGRGVWPYQTTWIWGSASAFLESGQTVGFNMGAGFGDARAPDNAVILDGRVHKLDQIGYEYVREALTRPWRMTSCDGRLRLEFAPFKERVARSNLLLVMSEVHQIFGHYSGTLTTDDGQAVTLRDVVGFVEEHRARW